jgi:hypothetical protein
VVRRAVVRGSLIALAFLSAGGFAASADDGRPPSGAGHPPTSSPIPVTELRSSEIRTAPVPATAPEFVPSGEVLLPAARKKELVLFVGGYGSRVDDRAFDHLAARFPADRYVLRRLGDDPRFPYDTYGAIDANAQILTDEIRNGTVSPDAMAYLVRAVRERRSVLVSGGTSSGKTTTLNALAFAVGDRERIVTIEDAAELRLPQPNVVALETRAPSVEGSGTVDVRALLRAALRMRPDRIVIGELRGGEALDMLQAMNTGHRGSLTTAHANGAPHALTRIETMALMGGIDLPLDAIREQIRRGIDVVVHQERPGRR